jgi:hypothetical protein
MEDVTEFQSWLQKLLLNAKDKLHITDETLAFILLREGTNYYFRTISKHIQNS